MLDLKIAGMIVATLLCIIGFVGLINGFLGWWAGYWGMIETKLTLQLILGYVFYPIAWLLGVPNDDLLRVGELIGQKIIINEFYAFNALTDEKQDYVNMSDRAKLTATYACCASPLLPVPCSFSVPRTHAIKWPRFVFVRPCARDSVTDTQCYRASATSAPSALRSVCWPRSRRNAAATSPRWPSRR